MNVLGIVSEYNPFHNGHAAHIGLARAQAGSGFAVALMSGNFVQRGEPAIADKYLRAKMALLCGADMVLELPVCFATSSAEHFAHYAVRVLNACGAVSSLAFGSETGGLAALEAAADALSRESGAYRAALKAGLDRGEPFARARDMAASADAPAPRRPNDILAVEYLKAIRRTRSPMKPIAIPRAGAGYHDAEITGSIASATAIRRDILAGGAGAYPAMPAPAAEILRAAVAGGNYSRGLDAYAEAFRYALLTHPCLDGVMDISEGLHNRFLEMGGLYALPSEIISAVKTKRYARTRLSRAALHILLDIRREDFERLAAEDIPYIRVLGMKKSAGALMKALVRSASCPVVTTLSEAKKKLAPWAWAMLQKEISTTDIYYLGMENKKPAIAGAEWGKGFVVV